jgi:hypothetical protein
MRAKRGFLFFKRRGRRGRREKAAWREAGTLGVVRALRGFGWVELNRKIGKGGKK